MRLSSTTLAVGCVLAVVLATPAAWADAILPPPDNCLDGTTPASGHCGPHCEPTACTTDADCGAAKCVELPLCTSNGGAGAGNGAAGDDDGKAGDGDGGCALAPHGSPGELALLLTLSLTLALARRRRASGALSATLLALALGIDPAFADAIPADPPCPPGQLVYPGGHQGSACGARACNSDADCPADQACMSYCSGGGFFDAPPTSRCSSDEQCGEFVCRPMYCEVGPRTAAPATTPSEAPAATGLPQQTAGAGPGEAGGGAGESSSGGASTGTHGETRKTGVGEEDEGCSFLARAPAPRFGTWALPVTALLVVAFRRRLRRLPATTPAPSPYPSR